MICFWFWSWVIIWWKTFSWIQTVLRGLWIRTWQEERTCFLGVWSVSKKILIYLFQVYSLRFVSSSIQVNGSKRVSKKPCLLYQREVGNIQHLCRERRRHERSVAPRRLDPSSVSLFWFQWTRLLSTSSWIGRTNDRLQLDYIYIYMG